MHSPLLRRPHLWIAVGLAHAATVMLAYQTDRTLSVGLGTFADVPFVEGFHEPVSEPGFARRWSQGRSTILLPGIEWHRGLELTLRASSGTRPESALPADVTVSVNGNEVGRFRAAPEFRNYRMPVAPDILKSSGLLRLDLEVPTFRQESRYLGVVVEKVKLQPTGDGVGLPPPLLVLTWTVNGLLWLTFLVEAGACRRRGVLAVTLGAGLLALAATMALAPHWVALSTEYATFALALGYGLAWQLRKWKEAGREGGEYRLEVLHTLGIGDRRWRVVVEGLVIAISLAQFTQSVIVPLREWGPKDLLIYRGAGTLWLEKGDYYDIPAFRRRFGPEVPAQTGFAFTNPPSGAALYSFLALLPVDQATIVWRGINLLLLIGTGYLLWSSTRRVGPSPPSPVWLVLALCTSEPLRITLRMGQVGILVLFLLALCLWAFERERRVLTGISLAAAALVKVLPGFPVVYFVARRDARTVGAAVLAGVSALGALLWSGGTRPWLAFVERVLPALSAPVGFFGNQSVLAFLHRAAGMTPEVQARFNFAFEPAAPPTLGWRLAPYGLAIALLALTAWRMPRRAPASRLARSLELATMIPLMLLIAPLVWEFYLLWLLVTYHVVFAVLAAWRLPRRAHGIVVSMVAFSWMLVQFDTTEVYRLPGWPVALMSLGLYATVLTFGCCLYLLGRVYAGPAFAPYASNTSAA